MNWFLLLLLLKALTVNWAAPIDLIETNHELQQYKKILDNSVNKTSGAADQAKNLIKTLDNVVTSTENIFSTSSSNDNLNETVQKVSQNLQNLTGEIRNQLEQSPVNIYENQHAPEESNANIFAPKDEEIPISFQNPVKSLTEYIEASQDTKNVGNGNEYHQFRSKSAPEYISSISSMDIESGVSDNHFTTTENKENLTFTENVERIPSSSGEDAEQVTAQSVNIVKQPTLDLKAPSFTSVVDSFIEDIVEFGSKLGLIPEGKRSEQTSTTTEIISEDVNMKAISLKDIKLKEEGISTGSIPTIEQHLESQVGKIKEITLTMEEPSPLESFYKTQENHTEMDQYSKNLKFSTEPNVSLINQVADIDSNIHKESEKFITESSVIPPTTDNSNNPDSVITTKETITETPFNLKPDDTSVQVPSFTTAIDSFIEDIVEFGSKLGLIPEEKQNEHIPTVTEISTENLKMAAISLKENKLEEEASSTTSISSIEQSLESQVGKIKEITVAMAEPKTTTSLESFNQTQENPTEIDQYSKNSTFLKEPNDSLINQVADSDSNIHKESEKLVPESSVIPQANDNSNNPDSAITTKENIAEMPFNLNPNDTSLQAPSFATAVDSFLEDIVEFGSKLGLIPEGKQNEQIPTTTEIFSENVNIAAISLKENKLEGEGSSTTPKSNIETTLDLKLKIISTVENVDKKLESLQDTSQKLFDNITENLEPSASETDVATVRNTDETLAASTNENFMKHPRQNAEQSIAPNNNDAVWEITNLYQGENSDKPHSLKENIDSLINQEADIDSYIQSDSKKLVIESSVIQEATDSPIIIEANKAEMPVNLKQSPSFTPVVDSFIEDITETGSKLGLTPEGIQNEETSTTTENFRQHVNMEGISLKDNKLEGAGSSPTFISSIKQSLESQFGKINEKPLTMEEPKTITSSSMESFIETQENHTELDQYSKNSNFLKETIDSVISQVADIESKIHKESEILVTESPVIPQATDNSNNPDSAITTKENFTEMPFNRKPDDTSGKAPSFTTAVDSFIEDIVEFGSKLGLIPEMKQNEQISTTTEIFTEHVNMEGISLKENKYEQEGSSTTPISNADTSPDIKSKIISTTQSLEEIEENIESLQDPSQKQMGNVFNNITEYLEPSASGKDFATLINADETLTAITYGNVDTGKIYPFSANFTEQPAVIQEATDNSKKSDSHIIIKANLTDMPFNLKQAPSFTEVVDSFIEDITEIGSTLGLIPEEKQNEQTSTTTNIFRELGNMEAITFKDNKLEREGSSTKSISSIEQSQVPQVGKTKETTLKMEEPKVTTKTPLEKLDETQEDYTVMDQFSKNSNYSKSLENVADAIVEIGSNIGKTFTDFLSLNKSNESLTEIASSEQQTIMENPSTAFKIYNKVDSPQTSNEETTKTLVEDNKRIEIPANSNKSFLNPSENILRTFNGNVEFRNRNDKDIFGVERQGKVEKNVEEDQVRQEKYPAKYVDHIPLDVIGNPESETVNTSKMQQSEEKIAVTDEIQESQAEVAEVRLVEIETSNKEENFNYNLTSNRENTFPTTEMPTTTKESSKTEDYTTSPSLVQEIFPSLNKFESTLKPLIEKEKFKQEGVYNTNLEAQQLETSTSTPNTILLTTLNDELTTISPIEETTVIPKKLEEELQMAVKALEETTHYHFEEFQNNLKEAIKKFTVWGAERQEETSTLKSLASETSTTESGARQQSLKELSATIKPEFELTSENNLQVQELVKLDDSHRSGAIRQNFVDKFAANYKENFNVGELQTEKQLPALQEREFGNKHTTETPKVLTTILPTVMEDEVQIDVKDAKSLVQITTIQNEIAEATTVQNTITDESSGDEEQVPTEHIPEITSAPLLARVSLQKDTNSFSLKKAFEIVTEVTAQEPITHHLDAEHINSTHSEFTPTSQPIEETITIQTPENSLQEMVTFIELTETTTNSHPTAKEEVKENFATAQTQVPLTQASFMTEQQQQIESTTEHEAQTETAAENEQAVTIQQQTTEAEIHSTTEVEETETTVAPVEQEARSLSLPPPKLEYLQNEDGVEIFYGYSIVKRN